MKPEDIAERSGDGCDVAIALRHVLDLLAESNIDDDARWDGPDGADYTDEERDRWSEATCKLIAICAAYRAWCRGER